MPSTSLEDFRARRDIRRRRRPQTALGRGSPHPLINHDRWLLSYFAASFVAPG
jgi:hypothetical protein